MKILLVFFLTLLLMSCGESSQRGSSGHLANNTDSQELKIEFEEGTLIRKKRFELTGTCIQAYESLEASSKPELDSLEISDCINGRFTLSASAPENGIYKFSVHHPDSIQYDWATVRIHEFEEIAKFDFEGQTPDIRIKGDLLYIKTLVWHERNGRKIADDHVRVLDISKPRTPKLLKVFEFPNYTSVVGTDRYVYAFVKTGHRSGRINVFDFNPGANKGFVSSVECCESGMSSSWLEFPQSEKWRDIIYTKDRTGLSYSGLDVRDPLSPKVITREEINPAIRGGYFVGDFYFTHKKPELGSDRGLYIYKTNRTNKWPLRETISFGGSSGLLIGSSENKLYIRANRKLFTLNVKTPRYTHILEEHKLDHERAVYAIHNDMYFFSEQYYDGFGLRYDVVKPGLPIPKKRPPVGTEYFSFHFHKGYVFARAKHHIQVFGCLPGYECRDE